MCSHFPLCFSPLSPTSGGPGTLSCHHWSPKPPLPPAAFPGLPCTLAALSLSPHVGAGTLSSYCSVLGT